MVNEGFDLGTTARASRHRPSRVEGLDEQTIRQLRSLVRALSLGPA